MKSTLLLLCILLLAGCEEKIEPGRVAATAPLVANLPLITLQPTRKSGAEQFIASVESRDRALLAARSSGMISRL